MNNEQHKITEELLLAYVCGTLSEEERLYVEKWQAQTPENAALLEQLFEAYSLSRAIQSRDAADTTASFNKVQSQIWTKNRNAVFTATRSRYMKLLGRIAAAAVIVVAIVVASISGAGLVSRVEQPLVVRTEVGERVQVQLPDGSRVWLNACSEIAYGPRLFSSERSVAVKGEVYFEVQKMDGAPFVVHCNQMDIRVLGTKFNVQANDDDNRFTTTLLEGAIQVTSPLFKSKRGVVMQPNQQLVFDKSTGMAQLTTTDHARASRDWVDGRFQFNKVSFEEIARHLERNYNVSITFRDDKIRQKQFICDFDSSDNIYRILSIMKLTGKFEYKIQGRQIEIQSL